MQRLILVGLTFVQLSAVSAAAENRPVIVNAEFTAGAERPAGWTLSGGAGRWVERQALEVTGSGSDSNFWRTDVSLSPAALYHFRVRVRRGAGGSGSAIVGPAFANRDYHALAEEWQWHDYVFRTPDRQGPSYLRLGQWMARGPIQFDAVQLTPVLPVYRQAGSVFLGDGETLDAEGYRFRGTFEGRGGNFHRPLISASAAFNSDRWCFGAGGTLVYAFAVPAARFTSGQVLVNVNYHTGGVCQIEVSRDQQTWQSLTQRDQVGESQAALPAALLPAERLYLRLQGAGPRCNFQINRVEFRAPLDVRPVAASGATVFVDVEHAAAPAVAPQLVLEGASGEAATLVVQTAAKDLTLRARHGATARAVKRAAPNEFRVSLDGLPPGTNTLTLTLADSRADVWRATLDFMVPDFYRADYGQRLADGPAAAVWWCDATHKIARQRGLPDAAGTAARLSAARNDFEAVQVVVRPKQALAGLTAVATPLVGPQGATIGAEQIRVLRAYYHFVEHPTDATGVRDFWPDALPPLAAPLDLRAGENQPLWVLCHVPAAAPAGDYRGTLRLQAAGWSQQVPIELHVWNFALPAQNHLATAFGLSPGLIFRYHQLKSETDRRRVLDLYLRSFAEHRISPYDPTPLDPIRVKFVTSADPPRVELDFTAFDAAMTRAVEQYHFTQFRLNVQGMGGGTFQSRHPPQIGPFQETTPQYQALFASYVKQLEEHLRQKDWLRMAYIYWFDEPEPKDYPFVRDGMQRLRRSAPGLQRMLTEEPCAPLHGAVDIWCPVTFNYDHAAAEARRKAGERFWWYVCCGPKAPYCTLFIDHPATELRVLHWQAWQYDVVGSLVWESNYWTSHSAFPDQPQNPYEDPMGYVSDYDTPRGVKRFWGNGDGRFLYPPLAAAVPGASGAGPVLDPPVSSIRWEMLREGIEDYEFLYRLRELLAAKRARLGADEIRTVEALLAVPAAISVTLQKFTTDPAPLYARRQAIAEAIERLSAAERAKGAETRNGVGDRL